MEAIMKLYISLLIALILSGLSAPAQAQDEHCFALGNGNTVSGVVYEELHTSALAYLDPGVTIWQPRADLEYAKDPLTMSHLPSNARVCIEDRLYLAATPASTHDSMPELMAGASDSSARMQLTPVVLPTSSVSTASVPTAPVAIFNSIPVSIYGIDTGSLSDPIIEFILLLPIFLALGMWVNWMLGTQPAEMVAAVSSTSTRRIRAVSGTMASRRT
jgi:hypothetical protein